MESSTQSLSTHDMTSASLSAQKSSNPVIHTAESEIQHKHQASSSPAVTDCEDPSHPVPPPPVGPPTAKDVTLKLIKALSNGFGLRTALQRLDQAIEKAIASTSKSKGSSILGNSRLREGIEEVLGNGNHVTDEHRFHKQKTVAPVSSVTVFKRRLRECFDAKGTFNFSPSAVSVRGKGMDTTVDDGGAVEEGGEGVKSRRARVKVEICSGAGEWVVEQVPSESNNEEGVYVFRPVLAILFILIQMM